MLVIEFNIILLKEAWDNGNILIKIVENCWVLVWVQKFTVSFHQVLKNLSSLIGTNLNKYKWDQSRSYQAVSEMVSELGTKIGYSIPKQKINIMHLSLYVLGIFYGREGRRK